MNLDITIIGAGLVGMTAACALADKGYKIAIIDIADISKIHSRKSDGRTCAIAAGSMNFFTEIGLSSKLLENAGKIEDIRVSDGDSNIFLHYDHKLVGEQPLGHIIENYHIFDALLQKAKESSNIIILDKTKYQNIEYQDDRHIITLDNGKIINSFLLIGADGKNSKIRQLFGINVNRWDYKQAAIICIIKHQNHHGFIAQERFLPQGPFAILPMHDSNHSSIVWTEEQSLAKIYLSMNKVELIEQLMLRAGEYLGKITDVDHMASYNLSLCKAKNYISDNMLLIGDAAHSMHPLAGQGFNVGIRDIEQIYKLLPNNISDIKDTLLNNQLDILNILKDFEKTRMLDSVSLLSITDILTRVFSNNITPLRSLRRAGMFLVNNSDSLKKFFMNHAMYGSNN